MKNKIKILLLLFAGFVAIPVFAQQKAITGTILDEYGDGLPGATVQENSTSNATITDMDGNFSLKVSGSNSVIAVSFVGYKKKEVTVGNQTHIRVQMENDAQLIDEVVVVGFGTQKKINATGAVKTVDGKILESRPVSNAVQGLQGVIAGLNITNDNGGALGQEMEINIRGIGSIDESSSSKPLVLIDGMEGDLSTINPNDIESYSVLKDASAASIYGSRAPFGVILVTTKSGERGTRVSYSGNLRVSSPVSVPDPVDSYTYALMVNEAFINTGGNAQFAQSQLDKIVAYQLGELPYGIEQAEGQNDWAWNQRSFGNTNWYDTFLKKNTTSREHNLSVSGGGDKVVYYFSGSYLEQTGLFKYADEKYNRFSINGKIGVTFNNKVRMVWNTRLVVTENDSPSAMDELFFHNLGRRSPLMPVYMPNGEYNKESLIPSIKDGGKKTDKGQQLYNQATFTYEPLKDWKVYADLSSRIESPRGERQFKKLQYTLPDGTTEYFSPLEGVADKAEINATTGKFIRQPGPGTSYYEKYNGHIHYFNMNLYTDYEKRFHKHYVKVLGGMQSEYYYTETTRIASDDILLDEKPFLPSTSGTNTMMSDKKGEWASLGFFGRVNYVYADRYMAEFNLRYDGASRFPSDQRWAMFPSFSLGWNIAQESFWQPLASKGFEYLKLRGSYGKLGNQNTNSFYPYYQKLEAGKAALVLGGEQALSLPMYSPYSVNLTWEKIENLSVGLDWGFFRNRLSGSFDWYQRTTKDMVGPSKALSAVYGADAPKTNNAELRTRGWELELSWRDRVNKDFNYGITATLSDYETIITKYDSPDGNLDGWYSGKKYGDIWGYEVVGIAKSDKEMAEYLALHDQSAIGDKWGGGDLMYRDRDGNGAVDSGSGTINDHGDLTVIGNGTPRYAFGLSLDATWKFIDVRLFFQGIGKRDVFFKNSATFFGMVAEWQRSLYTDHLDYFRYAGSELGANMDPYYGRLRTDQNNIQVSDRFLQNAAYIRLKNMQVGFSLPKSVPLGKYVDKARIYVSGENLFTLTGLKIYDPEAVGKTDSAYGPGKTYPMYRVWSVGVELTF